MALNLKYFKHNGSRAMLMTYFGFLTYENYLNLDYIVGNMFFFNIKDAQQMILSNAKVRLKQDLELKLPNKGIKIKCKKI